MTLPAQLAALLAIVCTGVVYGTDVFCAIVQRPALVRVDDAALNRTLTAPSRQGGTVSSSCARYCRAWPPSHSAPACSPPPASAGTGTPRENGRPQ